MDGVWTTPHSLWTTAVGQAWTPCGGHARAARRPRADQRQWPCTRLWTEKSVDVGRRDSAARASRDGAVTPDDRGRTRCAALRRIAFLLERRPRGQLPDQGLPRRRGRDPAACRPTRCAAAAGPAPARPAGHRRQDRPRRRRRACAGERAGVPRRARAGRRAARRGRRGATARALRGDLHSHSDWSDGGSPIEEMAMTAIELGHEYLVLTDHSPRLTVANGLSAPAAAPGSSTWSTRSTSTSAAGSGCCAASRWTSSTTARSTRPTRCSAGSTCVVASRALQAARWTQAAMTRRMVAAVAQPGDQRARATAPAGWSWAGAAPGRRASSTPRRSSPPARSTTSRWRSTPGPSGATRPTTGGARAARPAACSRSTATRTPRASSTSSTTAASGPAAGRAAGPGGQHLAAGPAAGLGERVAV